MIRKVNPVAKALLTSRRRTAVVPDKRKHNKKKERQHGQRTKHVPHNVHDTDGGSD